MKIFKKILIATDGSEHSKRAVSAGVELAKATGAELYVIYVVHKASLSPITSRSKGWNPPYEILEEVGKEALLHAKNVGRDLGVEVNTLLLEGYPSTEIMDFSEKNEIDMIVMGTLGKTGVKRFLMGSVAEKVVRNSSTCVLVVR